MEKVSKTLTDYIIGKGMIEDDDREIYEYGFQIATEVGLFILFCLVTTLHLHMYMEAIMFFIIFVPLRSYAGGLHLEKYHSCLILSCLTFCGVLLIVRYIQVSFYFSFIVLLILEYWVFRLYPVENLNRKVDDEENRYFKKKLVAFLLLDLLIAIACIILHSSSGIFVITVTFTIVMVTMAIGKYKDKRDMRLRN